MLLRDSCADHDHRDKCEGRLSLLSGHRAASNRSMIWPTCVRTPEARGWWGSVCVCVCVGGGGGGVRREREGDHRTVCPSTANKASSGPANGHDTFQPRARGQVVSTS